MAKTSAVPYTELPIEELTALLENAISEFQLNNIEAMATALSEAIAHTSRNTLWANALLCRAKVHVLLWGNKIAGLEDLLAAHYYYVQIQDEKKQCDTSINIGFCYLWAGLVEFAVEQFSTTYILAKKNNIPEIQARVLKLLADAHGIMGDYTAAASYSQEALDIARQHNFSRTFMAALYALIQAYNHIGKHSEAMPLAEMGLDYALQQQNTINIELAYNMKSLVYHRLGEYTKAIFWIRKSERILQSLPPTAQRRWQTQLQKSVFLCDAGKTEQALRIAKTILYDAPIKHDALFLIEIHRHLAHVYSLLNDEVHAAQHSRMKSEFQLQYTGTELQQRVKVLTISLNAERFRLEAQLERERAQHLEKELTVLALHLAQKNEMLRGIEQKLHALEKTLSRARKSIQVSMKSVVNEVKSDINASQHADKSWQIFEQQFSTIHPEFVRTLSQRHPDLTSMELRLCALMKVSLNTKQIANILCINAGSVDVYRFRIRKKIGMKRGDNLSSYLAGI